MTASIVNNICKRSTDHNIVRKRDAARYLELNPNGEAKTIRVGFMRVPFWRCRPLKGQGGWKALPAYEDIVAETPQPSQATMTAAEKEAVLKLAQAWDAVSAVLTDPDDLRAAAEGIHAAQHRVMIQPTIRNEPTLFRQRTP